MKIAIPLVNAKFSAHFGGAKEFVIFEADDNSGSVGTGTIFPAPAHKPGFLPEWIAAQGVDAVVAHAIGERALIMLANAGIEVFLTEMESEPVELATACLEGKLPRATKDNSHCRGDHHGGHDHDHGCDES